MEIAISLYKPKTSCHANIEIRDIVANPFSGAELILLTLIFRKENLNKILLSNQALDPREVFAQKRSFILSDGKLNAPHSNIFFSYSQLNLQSYLVVQFLHLAFLISNSINAPSPAPLNSLFSKTMYSKQYRQISSLPLC